MKFVDKAEKKAGKIEKDVTNFIDELLGNSEKEENNTNKDKSKKRGG